MKKISVLILLLILSFTISEAKPRMATDPTLSDQARVAFHYLNKIRANPKAFSKEINIDLSDVKPRPALIWNEKLARSAQKKAEDMAKRDYLGHHTPEGEGPGIFVEREGYILPMEWPDATSINYIESVSGGSSRLGIEHIKNLIYDHGAPHSSTKANHRKHILGMNKFWSEHVDIGIGFAYNPKAKYKGYFVIHTARPGKPSVTISGKLYAARNQKWGLKNVWIGAIDKAGKKYWTKVTLGKGQTFVHYKLKVPANKTLIMRYFKDLGDKKYIRGYYSPKETVFTIAEAHWMKMTTENISGIDMMIKEGK